MTFIAKGLAGSRSQPRCYDKEGTIPHYINLLLHLVSIEDHSLEGLKNIGSLAHSGYKGIDMITGNRWGIWDLAKWSEEQDIPFEAVYPTYDRQKEAFSELYMVYNTGRFKTPPLGVPGFKQDDILKEEASVFDHDSDKHWFGSPQKMEKYGIQDNAMYSLGWGLYGAKLLTVDDFRARNPTVNFGLFASKLNVTFAQRNVTDALQKHPGAIRHRGVTRSKTNKLIIRISWVIPRVLRIRWSSVEIGLFDIRV